MAFVDIGRLIWPTPIVPGGNQSLLLSQVVHAFDSATDRLAWVGRSELTDSVTAVHIRTATVIAGSTLEARIETVVNGRPSGTLIGTNTNGTVVVADSDDGVWKTVTLTAAAALTRGQEYAVVLVNSSGTPNMQLGAYPAGMAGGQSRGQYPLCLQDTGAGTWAGVDGFEWVFQFASAGVQFVPGLFPVSGAGTITAFNSGSSPNERALRFQVPGRMRVLGLRVPMFNIAAGGDFTLSLWDATGDTDGEALAQVSFDGDFALSTTQDGLVDGIFAAPVELEANTTNYIGIRANTANNIGVGELSNSTIANALRCFPGVNLQTYLATRSWSGGTAGAWSTTTTTLLLAYLIVDRIDDGAGGAAAIANLRGNFQ